jgi:PilZ domain
LIVIARSLNFLPKVIVTASLKSCPTSGAVLMSESTPDERRQWPRRRLGRLAALQFWDGGAQRYCLVTDISDGGVQLHINGFNVPDDFMLIFPKGGPTQSGNYKVVWRNGLELGAKFVSSLSST